MRNGSEAVVPVVFLCVGLAAAAMGVVVWFVRRRNLDRWLPSYLISIPKRREPRHGEAVHLLLCVADHYEPRRGGVDAQTAQARVDRWVEQYPRMFGGFGDSDGRPPRHTFFYPMEKYERAHLDALAGLCRAGFGEVEIHLHHEGETPEELREKLLQFKHTLSEGHGLLSRRKRTGAVAYGFIHGDWALDNSGPHGRHCGVNNELDLLRETGCYADFTLPSAPERAQTRKINSIYYAVDDPRRPRSHDWGADAGARPAPDNGLLLIQGPLLLDWRRRKAGLLPRIENGCLQGNQPPTAERLGLWLKARVQVPTRPDWYFVKLHTHGAPPSNADVLLGEANLRFHQALADRAQADPNFYFHYVTAREMYNLVRAAEAGWTGPPAGALDFELEWNRGRAACVATPAKELAVR
jgi:hypothetical protein